jgi:hypothetical protein
MCMCVTIRLGGEGKAEVVVTKRRLNAMHRSDGDTGETFYTITWVGGVRAFHPGDAWMDRGFVHV